MNKLVGKINSIHTSGNLSIAEILVNLDILKAVLIETPESAPFLKKGETINVIFKETEVSIAKNFSGKISLQNRLNCRIVSIENGELLSKVILDYKGDKLISIITQFAVKDMELNPGDEVAALIKTNEVILSLE